MYFFIIFRAIYPSSILIDRFNKLNLIISQVIDHYENPRNVGSMDKKDMDVGTGLVGAPACGDVMKLQIRVDDEGKIIDAKFKTFGCGSAIASSSLATEWVKGKTVWENQTFCYITEMLIVRILSIRSMRRTKWRTPTSLKNFLFHLLSFTVRCWRKMPSKRLWRITTLSNLPVKQRRHNNLLLCNISVNINSSQVMFRSDVGKS